jgi:D-alanyl-lipoteichoic acid acyltransferase DltB (MBOAT superfamily)
VLFGFLHGLGLALEKCYETFGLKPKWPSKIMAILGWVWAVGSFYLSLVIFRSYTIADAVMIYEKLFSLSFKEVSIWYESLASFHQSQVLPLLLIAMGTHLWKGLNVKEKLVPFCPFMIKVVFLSTLSFWLIHFYPSGKVSPFIYFQF